MVAMLGIPTMSASQQAEELRLQCAAQSQDAEIARLRGTLERARPVVVKAVKDCETCQGTGMRTGVGYAEASLVRCEFCFGDRAALREIDAALRGAEE
jgi:hypothetical protein